MPAHKQPIAPVPSRNPKSDFVKMSVTVPPDMHEQLMELSRARRKAKQPYMISELVREALAGWLPSGPRDRQ